MSPFAGLCPLSKANYIHLQSDNAVSGVSIRQQWLVLSRDLIEILTSACMLQSSKLPEFQKFFWLQIPISACLSQSYKLPEFQKFFGCRYRSLPVCFKVTSYQSFRSFLVADTNLCLSVSKFQVTKVPEVFWWQIPISACLFQSSKLPEFQKFFGGRY